MKYILILSAIFCFSASAKEVITMDVFYDGTAPIRKTIDDVDIQYFDVGGLSRLDQSLSFQLPSNERDASVYLSNFFNSNKGKEWIADAKHNSEGLTRLLAYELQGVPAIVINGQLVVYGTTDVEVALREYDN